MMKKFNTKIFIKKVKHSLQNIGSDADKDWRIILSIFVLATITSIIWHINIFINSTDQKGTLPNVLSSGKINIEVLENMTLLYTKRAEEFKRLLEDKRTFIDPAH
jgi:hypothetical protein